MNDFQVEFMKRLSAIQERNVQSKCSEYSGIDGLENILYDTTFDLITDFLVLIDGYDSDFKYKIKILNEENENMKENPFIELHDKNEDYLKYKK